MAAKKQQRTFDFIWEGVNQNRAKTGGEVVAPSLSQARAVLRQRGIRVTRIKKKPQPLFGPSTKVKSVDISFAARQMSTMIGAGIPISQTMRAIGQGHENKGVENLMMSISRDVESGTSLSLSLNKFPEHFNQLFVSLTEAGEQSGQLDTMLDRVATYSEKLEALRSKVKSALMYPLIVLMVALGVTVLLLLFVIPAFEDLFSGVGAQLPTLTRVIVTMSEWLQANWLLAAIAVVGGVLALKNVIKRSEELQYKIDQLLLNAPVFGFIVNKSALARFSRTLSIIFGSGVPLVEGMDTVGAATGSRVYQRSITAIKNEISAGHSLEGSMRATGLFPNVMLQMVASGEESGELETMLEKIADFYEREVDDAVAALSSIIEPVMIVLMGGIIGTMVVAMYLPVFQLASVF